jgi:tellurite resistance protein
MSLFDKAKSAATAMIDGATKTINRAVGAQQMQRIAAICAMMAYLPDGDADDDEIDTGIAAIMQKLGANTYSVGEMRSAVDRHVATLKASKRMGKIALMDLIKPAKGTDEAIDLVQFAAAVGDAPSPNVPAYTEAEKALAIEIADWLGVPRSYAD